MNLSANTRRAIYLVALAVVALLVGYGILHDDQAELWTALVYAILGLAPLTALNHITPDPVNLDGPVPQEPPYEDEVPPQDKYYQPGLPFDEDEGPTGP